MSTLVEQALSKPSRRKVTWNRTPEEIDLALAYVAGQVNGRQVCAVLGFQDTGRGSFYLWLARTLSQAIRIGRLIESHKPNGDRP